MAVRYRPIRRLARGVLTEVFVALDEREGGRQVVIKRVTPALASASDIASQFRVEAELARKLHHPNIVRVLDSGLSRGAPYLTMEWLDGLDLRALLRSNAHNVHLPTSVACAIARRVARGLAYAHALADEDGNPLHIVHRDVSPDNVLITYDGAVKVLDFGIAKSTVQLTLTSPGLVKGKLPYMSPEQISGLAVDARSDVFSLGTVFWEMLTGRRLWKRDTMGDASRAICEVSAPPPSMLVPHLPIGVEAVVMAMLAKLPGGRPPLSTVIDYLGQFEPPDADDAIGVCARDVRGEDTNSRAS